MLQHVYFFQEFSKLASWFCQFDSDYKAALRTTCFFLTKTKETEGLLQKYTGKAVPADGEEFLTEFAAAAVDHPALCEEIPVLKQLSHEQRLILRDCYLPAHFRHMLFTEGGKNMFEALKSISEDAYRAWYARWMVNLFGFNSNRKYYNQEIHMLCGIVVTLVDNMRRFLMASPGRNPVTIYAPRLNPFDEYLLSREQLAGFKKELVR